jgi:hypothetical protein
LTLARKTSACGNRSSGVGGGAAAHSARFTACPQPHQFCAADEPGQCTLPARSVANLEFHHTGDDVNDVARRITAALEHAGIRAMNPPMGFPMEADRWGYERMWVVAHKPIAVAAGLGHMGIHRNVIHPEVPAL